MGIMVWGAHIFVYFISCSQFVPHLVGVKNAELKIISSLCCYYSGPFLLRQGRREGGQYFLHHNRWTAVRWNNPTPTMEVITYLIMVYDVEYKPALVLTCHRTQCEIYSPLRHTPYTGCHSHARLPTHNTHNIQTHTHAHTDTTC